MALFYQGRKNIFQKLRDTDHIHKPTIWVHTASLGEYEQGLPVIELLMDQFPEYQLLVTFFSPSGYEIVAKKRLPFTVSYLPLDTRKNVKKFIELVQPQMALFVKYEIWPNYFRELKKKRIPLFIISARFHAGQAFFKNYGGILRESLKNVTHFFVQDSNSAQLLQEIGLENVTITGDTRLDRVSKLSAQKSPLPILKSFLGGQLCIVAGSTWPEDDEVLLPSINKSQGPEKYIIAPHKIDPVQIALLKRSIQLPCITFSEMRSGNVREARVLILDTIGLLSQIYRYGDVAYVGGGFATGLHNTLEPAVYGIPIIIGPQYSDFKEARDLVKLGGIIPVKSPEEFNSQLHILLSNEKARENSGSVNREYIEKNKGASVQILAFLRTYL